MKNRLLTGALFFILGLLIAFGPLSFFPVCGVGEQELESVHGTPAPGSRADSAVSDQSSMKTENGGSQGSMKVSAAMVMKCYWTARAELGIGLLIALLGVVLLAFKSASVRLGFSLALIPIGILTLLIPGPLIGVCGGARMTCRWQALPALTVLGAAVTIVSAINALYLTQNKTIRIDQHETAAADHPPTGGK